MPCPLKGPPPPTFKGSLVENFGYFLLLRISPFELVLVLVRKTIENSVAVPEERITANAVTAPDRRTIVDLENQLETPSPFLRVESSSTCWKLRLHSYEKVIITRTCFCGRTRKLRFLFCVKEMFGMTRRSRDVDWHQKNHQSARFTERKCKKN